MARETPANGERKSGRDQIKTQPPNYWMNCVFWPPEVHIIIGGIVTESKFHREDILAEF